MAGDEVEPPVVPDEVVELGVDLAEAKPQLAEHVQALSGIVLQRGPGFRWFGHATASAPALIRIMDNGFGKTPGCGQARSGHNDGAIEPSRVRRRFRVREINQACRAGVRRDRRPVGQVGGRFDAIHALHA